MIRSVSVSIRILLHEGTFSKYVRNITINDLLVLVLYIVFASSNIDFNPSNIWGVKTSINCDVYSILACVNIGAIVSSILLNLYFFSLIYTYYLQKSK